MHTPSGPSFLRPSSCFSMPILSGIVLGVGSVASAVALGALWGQNYTSAPSFLTSLGKQIHPWVAKGIAGGGICLLCMGCVLFWVYPRQKVSLPHKLQGPKSPSSDSQPEPSSKKKKRRSPQKGAIWLEKTRGQTTFTSEDDIHKMLDESASD